MRNTYGYSHSSRKRRNVSIEELIFSEGILTGLFTAVYLKTGISIDPVDIMVTVLRTTDTAMKQISPSINSGIPIDTICMILPIIAFLTSVGTILFMKNRTYGAFIYLSGFLVMFIPLMFFLK